LRFSGKSYSDLDSSLAYAHESSSLPEPKKKVLFLHVFRDANLLLPEKEPGRGFTFATYFDWADFCLAEVSRRPDDWIIKPHPASQFYEGESEIIDRLLKKHSLPRSLLRSDLSTREILTSKWPVFTHSGTIGFETAIFGYRANVVSNRFPEELVVRTSGKAELLRCLREPVLNAAPAITDSASVEIAKVALFRNFQRNVPELSPRKGQPDRSSKLKFEASLITQGISLLGRHASSSSQKRLSEMAKEVISASGPVLSSAKL
jgi:hypothetical protein